MKSLKRILQNQQGIGILQITMGISAMMIAGAFITGTGQKRDKQIAALEFRLKTEQFRIQTLHQVMNDPHNCKCLLGGIEFTKNSATKIDYAGTSTSSDLGFYNTACTSSPSPILKGSFGAKDIKVTSIKLTEVEFINNSYVGKMLVGLETSKLFAGLSKTAFKIPLSLKVAPSITDPTKVKLVTCSAISTDGDPIGSLIKTPYMDDPADNVISLGAPAGIFSFNSVPASASGVIVQYTIGSPANKRSDRYCDIMGSEISVKLGMDSKGDGGQRMVAGTAYVPLDGCADPLRYSCTNSQNRGEFRVLAYVDDGIPKECDNLPFSCAAGTVPDGVGGCIPDLADTNLCHPGYVYDLTLDQCIPDPAVSCMPSPAELGIDGSCNSTAGIRSYIVAYRASLADIAAKKATYLAALATAASDAAAASSAAAAASADPTDLGAAAAASAAGATAAASAAQANLDYLAYKASVIYSNTNFISANGPLPVP